MGRRRYPIWEHAKEIELDFEANSTHKKKKKGFKCNFCKFPYSGGATRIRDHILGGSGNIRKCESVPLHVQEELTRKYKGHAQYP